jgi:choline transporter-like protein 2/4/5
MSVCQDAFSLLMRNILRVVVLNNIVSFLLFLGKVVITAAVGCLAYFVFSGSITALKDDIPSLNYFFTPIVVIVVGSYFIAASFFDVYEMAVDTLFLCFLEDLERNDGTPERPFFMTKGLRKVVGEMQHFRDDRD